MLGQNFNSVGWIMKWTKTWLILLEIRLEIRYQFRLGDSDCNRVICAGLTGEAVVREGDGFSLQTHAKLYSKGGTHLTSITCKTKKDSHLSTSGVLKEDSVFCQLSYIILNKNSSQEKTLPILNPLSFSCMK